VAGVVRQRIGRTHLPDGTEIAYALAGEGPYLVYVPGWLTHLELSWAVPAQRGFYETLAHGRTLVRYDQPGTGLSGPYDHPYTIDLERQTLAAVTAAVGARRFDLFGISLGAAVAADWAAYRPSTVDRLVLYGGWARGADIASPALREHVLALVTEHWGLGSGVLADIFLPGGDAAAREMFTRYQREAAPAATARTMLAFCYEIDVLGALHRIQAPTLVIHRDRDRAAPLAQGRALADGIPGARLEVVPG
jgi:pimeloyl-ACP methyl ester carboxylesterase